MVIHIIRRGMIISKIIIRRVMIISKIMYSFAVLMSGQCVASFLPLLPAILSNYGQTSENSTQDEETFSRVANNAIQGEDY